MSASFDFSPEVLRKALLKIYSKDFHLASDIETNLFNEVFDSLKLGIDKGVGMAKGVNPDDDFVNALRHSAGVFSAFKVHRAQRDMARLLLDSNGNLKPFEQWSEEAMPIASHQTGAWLRTEYDTAVLRARQAADWQQFVREKDVLPNLKWIPSTSVTPGEDHRIFWGLVRPVEDPFWNKHRPGDRWNCKCSLTSTADPPTRIPGGASAPVSDPQPGLRGNPGVTHSVFSDDHPYYPDSCGRCPFSSGLANMFSGFFNARRKKDCHNCRHIDKRLRLLSDPKYIAKRDYSELKRDPDYRDVRIDKKSGGMRATHVGHNDDTGKKEFFGNTMSGADLERACVEQLFKSGHKVILCDESKERVPGERYRALDMELDGRMMDIRSITGRNKWYTHALLSKNSQLKSYNAREDVRIPASAVCLYFHDPSSFNEKYMLRSINKYKHFYGNNGQHIVPLIKRVYVVIRGYDKVLEYDV
ncbi:phage minor head protein [Duncaniella muris]|uniref:phage head morphogenesis protein n=1 Tax=Duncaniella muris TaxID=2094150 RepID=UPI0027155627|nr:phage minor head protein [Duncaniella muris]